MAAGKSKHRKRLILFRHAKSAWPAGTDDHERPLADRGKKAAPVMGHYLAKSKLEPDLVLLSTARRAQDTWTRAARALKGKIDVRTLKEVYAAPADSLLALIRATDPAVGTLMIVGHNPGLEDLAKSLMKDTGGEAGTRLRAKYSTGGIAVLSFDVGDWSEVAPGTGSLDRFVTPKSLAES